MPPSKKKIQKGLDPPAMIVAKKTKFILVVALQLMILFAIIAAKTAILAHGTEVALRIKPVDPRDMLRGDYLAFRYDISDLDSNLFAYAPIKVGDTVYVGLVSEGKYWVAHSGIQKVKPAEAMGVFLIGKVDRTGGPISVVYGIEQYFIPEGKGAHVGRWQSSTESYAQVAISKSGKAVINKIYLNNKPWP